MFSSIHIFIHFLIILLQLLRVRVLVFVFVFVLICLVIHYMSILTPNYLKSDYRIFNKIIMTQVMSLNSNLLFLHSSSSSFFLFFCCCCFCFYGYCYSCFLLLFPSMILSYNAIYVCHLGSAKHRGA